jgi:biotin carboxyl carrier protein
MKLITQVVSRDPSPDTRDSRSEVVEVTAEIAASVWQVPASVGQTVAAGDTITILESMKMEIPVEAPVAGVIVEVRVAPNDQVNEGDVIAVIDES